MHNGVSRNFPSGLCGRNGVEPMTGLPVNSIHASCGARHGRGVLLLGASGSGKSDLLLRLVDRGFDLVADDRVIVAAGSASPPALLAGLIELRGVGLLRMAYVAPVPLALVLALDETAMQEIEPVSCAEAGQPRLPHPARHRTLGLPMLRIAPGAVSAALRIEIMMDCLAGRRSFLSGGLQPRPPLAAEPDAEAGRS